MELKLLSFLGLFVMVALAWACSLNRKLFPWRTVLWGVGLQFTLAWLILKTDAGATVFDFAQRAITKLIGFGADMMAMVQGVVLGPMWTWLRDLFHRLEKRIIVRCEFQRRNLHRRAIG